jgi:Kef-type K+ transport system membrane component KefB/nucleotide-binding universal stress UspA family protein
VLEPLGEHVLLPFILQLLLLLFVARLLGELMRRIGQPSVVGELGAGLLLGPSLFGRVAPDLAAFVFPGGNVSGSLILAVAQLGVLLLLVTTGFETDLQLLRRLGRPAVTTSAASLLVPLAAGYAVALALPAGFLGADGSRTNFALFIAVAVSISALAVSGRILTEMDLMRRDIGQIIVGVAMANELVGWVLLGLLTGIVLSGSLNVGDLLVTVGALSVFLAATLTLGQRVVDLSLRTLRAAGSGVAGAMTATVLFALAAAAVTQAIGVEAALGAFVAGIVLGRSRYQSEEATTSLELVTRTVFAPIFFATAGIFVDVGAIATPGRLFWLTALLLVAVTAKFAGAYLGTRWGGRDHATAVAMGVGLNARGTLEIVLATIALSLGVFNVVSYSTVVLVAMISALVTPPLLRIALRTVVPAPAEAERLERESVLSTSVIANVERALVPTRGGANSELAAQTLGLVLQPDASVTVLTVHSPDHPVDDCVCEKALDSAARQLDTQQVELRRAVSDAPAEAVLKEAGLGYGLLTLGMTEGFRDSKELSPTLRELLTRSEVPLLLVRHGTQDGRRPPDYRRLVVPTTGTRMARAAEEIAATLASRTDATIDLVHVVARPDRDPEDDRAPGSSPRPRTAATATATLATRSDPRPEQPTAQGLLAKAMARVDRFGVVTEGHIRQGVSPYEGVQQVADSVSADAIFLGAQVRSLEGQPFLGHGTEYLLEHARQTVVVVVFPSHEEDG